MASRSVFPVKSLGRELHQVVGSFAPAGTGAVTSVKGKGFTVSRTGVGVFLITFQDAWADLVSGRASVQLNALADTDAILGPYVAASKTLNIFIKTAGVAADIAANANNRVHFEITFRNSSIE